jgi:uncharacterized membrane protein YwaF
MISMEVLHRFFHGIAWPMDVHPLFDSFHLAYLAIGLAAAFLGACLLRKTNERQHRILLFCIGFVLLLGEINKQLFCYFAVGYEEYPFILFPFHLCTIPMYTCLFLAFFPRARLRQAVLNFTAAFGFIGGLMSVTVDSGIMRPYWVLTLHGLNWHFSLIFIGLYLGLSGRVSGGRKGFAQATGVFLGFAAAALCINLALWNISKGTIDMFFIGPKQMKLPVYSAIENELGRLATSLIYIVTLVFAALLAYLLLNALGAKRRHLNTAPA